MNRVVRVVGGLGAAALLPIASEMRLARAARPLSERWRQVPVRPRGSTELGISFRPRQVESLGLPASSTLSTLLDYPFSLIRLGAYWDRVEPSPGAFRPDELDRQIDACERAGKRIIVCVGAVKTFGYPEFFVPPHHRRVPLPEGTLVGPDTHPALVSAATAFLTRIVERYRDRSSIVAWLVEHDAVDPLGMEHSWRLSTSFVRAEVDAVRAADPTRPVMLNGFLPTSLPVRVQQWWRTRDQGDSLVVARQLADIVGIDYYPRHALVGLGQHTLYLDGAARPWHQPLRRRLMDWATVPGRQVMVSEGQAEPWETVTDPPNPNQREMYSCPPERIIENYNRFLGWTGDTASTLSAYLLWGAEYWVRRAADGDSRYLQAFARLLERS
jgi:hypothetical protein